jgi:hypothetical protein
MLHSERSADRMVSARHAPHEFSIELPCRVQAYGRTAADAAAM